MRSKDQTTKPFLQISNQQQKQGSEQTSFLEKENSEFAHLSHVHQHFGNTELKPLVQGQECSQLQMSLIGDVAMNIAGVAFETSSNSENHVAVDTIARHASHTKTEEDDANILVHNLLQQSGSPLPKALRTRLEQSFGHDLSDVRIHVGSDAQQATESVRAHAFAVGTHIAFNQGMYQPNTTEGDELIGHEVAHIVQFKEGRMGRATDTENGVPVTSPSDGVEQEAEAMGAAFARGEISTPTSDIGMENVSTTTGLANPEVAARDAMSPQEGSKEEAEEQERKQEEQEAKEKIEKEKQKQAERETPTPESNDQEQEEEKEEEAPAKEEQPTEDTGAVEQAGGTPAVAAPGSGGANPETVAIPALDNLVDYYMETHWDRSEYQAKLGEFDLALSEYGSMADSLGLGPNASIALGWAGTMMSIGMDAMIVGTLKAIPGVGSIFHVAYGIRDIYNNTQEYGALDDSFGTWVSNIRSVFDIVGSVVGNLGDLATLIEDVGGALAWTGIGAAVAGIAAICGTAGDTVGAICDGIKTTCSVILTVHNVVQAKEAERNGDFRRAAKYRELAQGTAIDSVVDFIGLVGTLMSGSTANIVPGEVVEDIAEGVGTVSKTLPQVLRQGVSEATGGKEILGRATGGGEIGKATGASVTDNLLYQVGLGDAMKLSDSGPLGGRYLSPSAVSGGGQVASILQSSRTASQERLDAAYGALEGDNPKWHQKVINDIINPPDQTFWKTVSDNMSPSTLAKTILGGYVSLINITDNMTHGAVSDLLRTTAAGIETVLSPAVQQLNEWITAAKPALDELASALSDSLQQQKVSLSLIREAIPVIEQFMGEVNKVMDARGGVAQFVESMTSNISGWKLTPEKLGIPKWIPEKTYSWAINGINSMIDGLASGIQNISASVLPTLDSFIERQTAWAQEQLDSVSEAVAEGGEVEQLLQAGVDSITNTISGLLEQFVEWKPVLDLGLTEAAEGLKNAASAVDDDSYKGRVDQFKEYLQTEAQSQVDAWKEKHKEDVETAYYMPVEDSDVQAVEEAWAIVEPRLEEAVTNHEIPFRMQLEAISAVGNARSQRGKKGQEALNSVWGAGDTLCAIAGRLGL